MSAASRYARALLLLTVAIGTTAACSVILGLEPPPSAGADDAAGSSDAAGCAIRYVSTTTGDDGRDGCSPTTAKKTIKAAIGVVETAGIPGYTVEVCAGTYAETSLKVVLAGSVLGGFDCTDWKRTATYRTDGVNETIVSIAGADANNSTTLTIGAPTSDAGSARLLVDGFTIRGPSAPGLTSSVAVQFASNSVGTLSNCQVLGGDASSTSFGVSVTSAGPEIAKNVIKSGSASQTMGILVLTSGASPSVHGNQITAGTEVLGASGIPGSFGIYISGPARTTLALGNPIAENSVFAGAGIPSIGIELVNVLAADVVHNRVESGHSLPLDDGGTAAPVGLRAIAAYTSSDVHILGNRVYGGGNQAKAGNFAGVVFSKVAGGVVANNMIYGGFRQASDKEPGVVDGINISGCVSPVVEANTIFAGFGGPGNTVQEINVNTGTTGAVVRNNILAGSGLNDCGIRVDDCAVEVANLENNLFFGAGTGTLRASCPDAGVTVTDISGLGVLKGTQVDGNLTLRATCDAADVDAGACLVEADCTKVQGSAGCLNSVFAAWSALDNGYGTLVGDGWVLKGGVSCRIARGGLDLTASPDGVPITTDLFGAPRGNPPSMGAAEQEAGCN